MLFLKMLPWLQNAPGDKRPAGGAQYALRKRMALLCVAMLCLTAFATAYHYHVTDGSYEHCPVCRASELPAAAASIVPDLSLVRISFSVPFEGFIAIPAAPALFAGTRPPPL